MNDSRKIIGIIGGMGPMATVDLFRKIVENTDADCDNAHLHVLIDNNTDIPDRTACILSGSDAPARLMTESAQRLEAMGAELLIIPCNTAHFFHSQVSAGCNVPILHMPEETAKTASEMGIKCVGLLATDGTVKSGVYDSAFRKLGIKILKPDEECQAKVMNMIYNEVKAGKPADTAALDGTLDAMEEQGCEAFVLGCTELPLAYAGDSSRRFLDPTLILARAAIIAANGKVRNEVLV